MVSGVDARHHVRRRGRPYPARSPRYPVVCLVQFAADVQRIVRDVDGGAARNASIAWRRRSRSAGHPVRSAPHSMTATRCAASPRPRASDSAVEQQVHTAFQGVHAATPTDVYPADDGLDGWTTVFPARAEERPPTTRRTCGSWTRRSRPTSDSSSCARRVAGSHGRGGPDLRHAPARGQGRGPRRARLAA